MQRETSECGANVCHMSRVVLRGSKHQIRFECVTRKHLFAEQLSIIHAPKPDGDLRMLVYCVLHANMTLGHTIVMLSLS